MKPKYLVDTVYLIAYLNPSDKLHSQAVNTLHQEKHSITYSSHALQELDLILKSRGYTPTERTNT